MFLTNPLLEFSLRSYPDKWMEKLLKIPWDSLRDK